MASVAPLRIAYLGDLENVADALKKAPGIELAAWIAEKDDAPAGAHYRVSSSAELAEALKSSGPLDWGVIANFGIILGKHCLTIPKNGFINAHMGLLPDYPGRRPIQKALEEGEAVVGVTLHRVTERVDEGPVLDRKVFAVGKSRDPQDVFERMARIIPQMIRRYLLE